MTIIQVTSQTCVPTGNSGEDDSELDIIGSAVIRSGTATPGMDELDINAGDRLAVSRIKMGDIEYRGRTRMASSFALKSVAYNRTRCTRASFAVGYSGICTIVF